MRRVAKAVFTTVVVGALLLGTGQGAWADSSVELRTSGMSSSYVDQANTAAARVSAQDSESESSRRYHALVAPAPFTDVRFVLSDQAHMYVAAGDAVYDINDRGEIERTITGLVGATGLAMSSDGTTLYVAETGADKIAAIARATGVVVSEFAVGVCPQHLVVLATTLFYSAGCSGAGSIGHINLITGQVAVTADKTLSRSDALIAATSDTLITADGHLRSWQITTADDGQPVLGNENGGPYFPHALSLTTHADKVVIIDSEVNGYGIYSSDLSPFHMYETVSSPTAIAWSNDGSLIAGGSDTPKGNGIRLINASDGLVSVQASIPSLSGREGYQAVVPGGLMFAADEKSVVALTQEWTSHGRAYSVARATTTPPSPSTVTVRVTTPRGYGKAAHIQVRTPGRPKVRVLVAVSGGSWHSSRIVTTDAHGLGSVDLVVPYSGTVTASLAGDLSHQEARPSTVQIRAPSALTITMARGYRVVRRVVHYSLLNDMRQRVLLSPRVPSRMVTVTLAYKNGSRWLNTKPFTLYTDANGYVNTAMRIARRSVPYRLTFRFSGDSLNTGSVKTSPVFILG